MFEQGNLLYFEPFIFKNGAKPKNKYMVVLGKDIDRNMIIASLPTSKDHVPGDMEVKAGCLELPDLGKLTDEYMCSLIDCLKKSRMVKNKYKRLLTSAI